MVHHSRERLRFVVEFPLFLCAFLVYGGVLTVVEKRVFEDDLLPVGPRGEFRVVDVHDYELELHFWFVFAGAGVPAIAWVELHVLDCFFGFVGEFGFEFEASGHVALDFMT